MLLKYNIYSLEKSEVLLSVEADKFTHSPDGTRALFWKKFDNQERLVADIPINHDFLIIASGSLIKDE